MNKTIRRSLIGLIALAVIGSVFWWRTLLWTGQLAGVRAHFDGQCAVIPGIIGAEDLVIDHENKLIFISSHDRRDPNAVGGIWVMPVNQPSMARQLQVPALAGAGFAPHGLDLWVGEDGTRSLFVIDHGSAPNHLVHKFTINGGELELARTFESSTFYSPNDLTIVGDDQFYITNDSRSKTGSVLAVVEALLRKQSGNVVWVDGDQAKIVATGFSYANGIAASIDGKQLYVSATIDQDLRIFDRNIVTGALTQSDQIHFGSALDNIDIAADGSLWIASHPRLLDFSAHANDPAKRSPSQVFHVDVDNKTVKQVYLSAGEMFSASSIAAVIDNKIFIGSVFDDGVLFCHQN